MLLIVSHPGAGKTTLVEILAGKSKSGITAGEVRIQANGNFSRAPRIGFVPQQDILPPMLTVFEALIFAARLKLPETISDTEKSERVKALLGKLGIENISNTRIGTNSGEKARGISGGEMRRVSIGMELIAAPDILVLDEPTSGEFITISSLFEVILRVQGLILFLLLVLQVFFLILLMILSIPSLSLLLSINLG